jgi:hypothetical protein
MKRNFEKKSLDKDRGFLIKEIYFWRLFFDLSECFFFCFFFGEKKLSAINQIELNARNFHDDVGSKWNPLFLGIDATIFVFSFFLT